MRVPEGAQPASMAIATVVVLGGGFALAFFYAPNDADQGFIQKIFYLHVPIAICALLGFVLAGSTRSATCGPAIRSTTCAPTSRSTSRRHLRHSRPAHGLDLGARPWGKWWVWGSRPWCRS